MKANIITVIIVFLMFNLQAQTKVSLPGVYLDMFRNYPYSNTKVTFSTQYPFSDYKGLQIDPKNSYQYVMSIPFVSDSLLSECIKYAMFSLSFDLAYRNLPNGTEIWYGPLANNINIDPTMTGIYYKRNFDSIAVYILTTHLLSYSEKKKKSNTSEYIGEAIRTILKKSGKKSKN